MFSYDLQVKLLAESKKHTALLERILHFVSRIPPPVPGRLSLLNLGENTVANTITFDVGLPALADGHDVASRELTSVIDGGTPDVRSATATDTVVTGFSAPHSSDSEIPRTP